MIQVEVRFIGLKFSPCSKLPANLHFQMKILDWIEIVWNYINFSDRLRTEFRRINYVSYFVSTWSHWHKLSTIFEHTSDKIIFKFKYMHPSKIRQILRNIFKTKCVMFFTILRSSQGHPKYVQNFETNLGR